MALVRRCNYQNFYLSTKLLICLSLYLWSYLWFVNPARSVIIAFALYALIQYSSVNQTLICWCNRNGKSLFASRTQPWSFIEFHKALNKKSTILIHWIKNLHFSTNIDEIHLISSFKVWNNFFMKKVFFIYRVSQKSGLWK